MFTFIPRNKESKLLPGENMSSLPEDCIAKILSFTDPREACRLSIVSSEFRRAAQSDTVWERFLPPDYQSILSNSDSASLLRSFPSKKQLYLSLCDITILIDDGKTSFWLDKWSGKKCFMISARGLTIIWGGTPQYWSWIADPNSRFGEIAELFKVWWLEIRGRINTSMLSKATKYSSHLVYNLRQEADGFDDDYPPLEVAVGVVNSGEVRRSNCSLLGGEQRRDGWLEIELGEFFNDKDGDGDEELEVSVMEIEGGHCKSGLFVEAIEIRPKITAN